MFRLGLAAVIGATAFTVYWMRPEPLPDTETLAVADIVRPHQPAKGIVFLFSGIDGYTQNDAQTARELAAAGALVVGIDLRKTFAKVESGSDCVYFVSDIEELSQLIQRSAGAETYLNPIIAGAGSGGSMVMAIAAQSPLATIGRAVAVDPKAICRSSGSSAATLRTSRPPTGRAGSTACRRASFPHRSPSSRRRMQIRQGRLTSPT